eukprot:8309209-Pyramimonas_sp.AAC.1
MPPGVALLAATAKPLDIAVGAALLNPLSATRIGSSFCTPRWRKVNVIRPWEEITISSPLFKKVFKFI